VRALYARLRHGIFKIVSKILVLPEPEVVSGPGSIAQIPELLKKQGIDNVLVVTDADLVKIGLAEKLLSVLKTAEIKHTVYNEVQPNPTIKNCMDGLKVYLENGCKGIIAFGGGSPLDCAKIIAAKTTNKKDIKKMKGLFKVWRKLPYQIAIPTTAGTGSEATIVAVISDPENREKFAINSPNLTPELCILDPELITGLPPGMTSTTGMDALTHAVEAYIGVIGTKYTNELALNAVKLVFEYLERSYQNGSDLEAREKMLLAAHDAGKAFTRAYVGYVHAVAHNLGGFYGIPHGLANAVVLPHILEMSKDLRSVGKMAEMAVYTGLGSASDENEELADKFIAKIRSMLSAMNIQQSFSEIREEDIPALAERIELEGNPTYPVPKLLWRKDFADLLYKLKG
jgi:alcohol dehydrogenase